MSNRLLKIRNLAPLLENELFVRALSLGSAEAYRTDLSWDEKNRYSEYSPLDEKRMRNGQSVGVHLLSTPAKSEGPLGTSANIVKLFEGDEPFLVLGVEARNGVVNLRNAVIEFGRYKNLEDAARVAIAIHENDSFEIPDCLEEKAEIAYPERPAAVKERRDREYVETMKGEIKALEDRIFDRNIWLREARMSLAQKDPVKSGEQAYAELHEKALENPAILNDPDVGDRYKELVEISQLCGNILHNETARKQEAKLLEKTRHRHDAFVERTYGPQVHQRDFYSRVI